MVDRERVERLLDRVADDIRELTRLREGEGDLLTDRTRLAAVKYHFVTAIEGCARVAHHLVVSEGWRVAETNAEAVRRLGAEGVVDDATTWAVAAAVGFRNVLVHQYTDVEDDRVRDNLERLDDLSGFVRDVARWLPKRGGATRSGQPTSTGPVPQDEE